MSVAIHIDGLPSLVQQLASLDLPAPPTESMQRRYEGGATARIRRLVLRALRREPDRLFSRAQIRASLAGSPHSTVDYALTQMLMSGEIVRAARGHYRAGPA